MSEQTKQATAHLRREIAKLRRQLRAEKARRDPMIAWMRNQEQRMAQLGRKP